MSRQRFIYPEIWRSEQFLALSLEARLLFIGIFSTADDYGRHKASAVSLKVEVFPADPFTSEQIIEWRDEIVGQGMIRLYRDKEGAEVLDIPSWSNFQKPKHVSPSRLPEFPGSGPVMAETSPDPDHSGPDSGPSPGQSGPAPDETRQHGASGVVWCGVEKSGVESPPSNRSLTGDVLGNPMPNEATAGMILTWKENDDGFREWKALAAKITAVGKVDPITLLAHILEIENSKAIRNKPATLFKRLAPPRPGTKRRVPGDKWYTKAKELLNESASNRGKSKPQEIGAVLGTMGADSS